MVVTLLRKLEHWRKQTLNLKKQFWIQNFLVSCRKNSVFPKFLQFKVSNKQLRTSKAYISREKRLLNLEVNNKQKAIKILQQKVIEFKNSLNCKMNYMDYVHV